MLQIWKGLIFSFKKRKARAKIIEKFKMKIGSVFSRVSRVLCHAASSFYHLQKQRIMNSLSSASYLHRNWDYKYNLVVCTYLLICIGTLCLALFSQKTAAWLMWREKEWQRGITPWLPSLLCHPYNQHSAVRAVVGNNLRIAVTFWGSDAICSSQERKRRVVPAMIRAQRLPELHMERCLFSLYSDITSWDELCIIRHCLTQF